MGMKKEETLKRGNPQEDPKRDYYPHPNSIYFHPENRDERFF
jgi:hypothetical protein